MRLERLLEAKEYKKVVKRVEKWIKKNSFSDHLDRALYLQGQGYFGLKLYYQALVAYEDLLDQFGASQFFADTLAKEVEIAKLFLGGAKRKIWKTIPIGAKTEGVEILEKVAGRSSRDGEGALRRPFVIAHCS